MRKLYLIWNIVKGKPVIYRVVLHTGDNWTTLSNTGEVSKTHLIVSENKGLMITECTFKGDGTGTAFRVTEGSKLHQQALETIEESNDAAADTPNNRVSHSETSKKGGDIGDVKRNR